MANEIVQLIDFSNCAYQNLKADCLNLCDTAENYITGKGYICADVAVSCSNGKKSLLCYKMQG